MRPLQTLRSVLEIPWVPEALQVLKIDDDPERGSRRVLEALERIQSAA